MLQCRRIGSERESTAGVYSIELTCGDVGGSLLLHSGGDGESLAVFGAALDAKRGGSNCTGLTAVALATAMAALVALLDSVAVDLFTCDV